MPEGPSLVIAKGEMQRFEGRKVLAVTGNSRFGIEMLLNKKLLGVKTWGKHLLLEFSGFSLRIHFLMFGSYLIDERKEAVPRLQLTFKNGELNFYSCAIKVLNEPLDELYDWTADVMNEAWDAKAARKKLRSQPDTVVTDALLDQTIFSGVGNIIKNEVLYRIRVHPLSTIGALPSKKLTELIREAVNYSYDFLEWKKEYTLRKHWLAHTKKTCSRDGGKIVKEYLGKTQRRTFYCPACQKRYG